MNRGLVAVTSDESGAVAIIVAILMMTVFLSITALVVDVGYLYETKRQLQAAADAGALAGCQEMVLQIKDPNVVALSEAVAIDYAVNKNLAAEATPTVDLADQSVTVEAGRTVNLFFATIFGMATSRVVAYSKAEVAYLVGVKDLDPMGVPNPKPKEVWVEVISFPSGTSVYKSRLGGGAFVDDTFEYNGVIPALADGKYRIDIIRVNNQGLEESLQGASALVVGANGGLGEVAVTPNFIKSDVSTSVTISAQVSGAPTTVEACWPKPSGNGVNTLALVHQGGGLYSATTSVNISAPSDPGYAAYPVTIKVDGVELPAGGAGAYMVVRDTSVEVDDVDLGTTYVASGTDVPIDVRVQGFEYERLYTLFLDNGSNYSGNYYGLDLDYAEYAPGTGMPYSPTGGHGNGSGGNAFSDALAGLLHSDPWAPDHNNHYYQVGDYMWTKTGAMVGPLDHGIGDRIGTDACTWDAWKNNATSHESRSQCPRLMTVPLVEETIYGSVNGSSKVRIVGFAQFFIEQPPSGGALQGRFVEYVKGGVYQKTPPPEPNIKTIHLVKPDGES